MFVNPTFSDSEIQHGLEKTRLTLGFIPLTDCAPLVIAQEKGFFAHCGLEVTLAKEHSWASIRDKVGVGLLDGAHMLGPMPLAATLGVHSVEMPMVTALALGLNGNAITVSNGLFAAMCEVDPALAADPTRAAQALAKVAAGRAKPLTFAAVFPFSSHYYFLRRWLLSAGIDLQREVEIVVVPPPQMVSWLADGRIDGYCVGEPWNAMAVQSGLGRVVITSYQLWNNHPEKVLGVHRQWAERYPNTHLALLVALLQAAQWLDEPHHRAEAVQILAAGRYIDAPQAVIQQALTGNYQYASGQAPVAQPDFNVFFRYAATFPWCSHAAVWLEEMRHSGQLTRSIDTVAALQQVYRPDLYRRAARSLGLSYPTIDSKPEGVNAERWTLTEATSPIAMGADCGALVGQFSTPHHTFRYSADDKGRSLRLDSPSAP